MGSTAKGSPKIPEMEYLFDTALCVIAIFALQENYYLPPHPAF
jgi:hypothetical protein